MLADSCRLYLTRPPGVDGEDSYHELALSMVLLNAALLLDGQVRAQRGSWRLSGPDAVTLESLRVDGAAVIGSGTVELSRAVANLRQLRDERFAFRCEVPSRAKTPRSVSVNCRWSSSVEGMA